MPTYSYRCTECGNEFDVRQSFSDEPLKVCEACGGSLRKLFNSVGIVFKGSGFYHNDARSSSSTLHSKNSEGREASDSAGSGSGESASSENGTSRTRIHETRAHKAEAQTPAKQPVWRKPPHRRALLLRQAPPLRQEPPHRSVAEQTQPRASAAREAPPPRKSARPHRVRAHSLCGRAPRPQACFLRERRRRTSP